MAQIWKFPLKTIQEQTIKMPSEFEFLALQVQNNRPCIWCVVNPSPEEVEDVTFYTLGTGHNISKEVQDNSFYIGTYQLDGGGLVFHVFQKFEP